MWLTRNPHVGRVSTYVFWIHSHCDSSNLMKEETVHNECKQEAQRIKYYFQNILVRSCIFSIEEKVLYFSRKV